MDEYYMVVFSNGAGNNVDGVRIYHIDARLNENGTAFMNDNLTFSPKPEFDISHGKVAENSPYLFLEEISSKSTFDFVLNLGIELQFTEGTTFGPNRVPSTDFHEGSYSGVQIDDPEAKLRQCCTGFRILNDISNPRKVY